eukprot:TRINITY_DN4958_c0_g1_i1.p1 TRINITY_DN4958_c0_g1~~TRINITY_DN4958_c0_g1_i1.p1  ORF type:complete len:378 (+),score=90.33 TRINITY_DN4958_c0_g1_i1:333-1466(+)
MRGIKSNKALKWGILWIVFLSFPSLSSSGSPGKQKPEDLRATIVGIGQSRTGTIISTSLDSSGQTRVMNLSFSLEPFPSFLVHRKPISPSQSVVSFKIGLVSLIQYSKSNSSLEDYNGNGTLSKGFGVGDVVNNVWNFWNAGNLFTNLSRTTGVNNDIHYQQFRASLNGTTEASSPKLYLTSTVADYPGFISSLGHFAIPDALEMRMVVADLQQLNSNSTTYAFKFMIESSEPVAQLGGILQIACTTSSCSNVQPIDQGFFVWDPTLLVSTPSKTDQAFPVVQYSIVPEELDPHPEPKIATALFNRHRTQPYRQYVYVSFIGEKNGNWTWSLSAGIQQVNDLSPPSKTSNSASLHPSLYISSFILGLFVLLHRRGTS